MRFPPCPNLRRTPPGQHTLRRDRIDWHRAGQSLCRTAVPVALFAAFTFVLGQFLTGAVVLGLACVLVAAGAVLVYRPDPPHTQCTRRYDLGHGRPWGRCLLPRGHQGTCVP